MIKVLVADDRAIVRARLKGFACDTMDIIVSGEAGNNGGSLKKFLEGYYDIAFLDISMHGYLLPGNGTKSEEIFSGCGNTEEARIGLMKRVRPSVNQ